MIEKNQPLIKKWHEGKAGNQQVRLSPTEIDIINKFRRIGAEAIEAGVDQKDIKHLWLKSDKASIFVKNRGFQEIGELNGEYFDQLFDGIIKKHSKLKKRKFKKAKISEKKALKATITDSHIGMNPNPDGQGIFQYEYNSSIFNKSLNKLFNSILEKHALHGNFEILYLDDLGDLADGWNGLTTRGGHDLPQNMTNSEVFEVCVDAKVNLISKLFDANISNKIILTSATNDNHSGDFGLVINKAIQKIINLMYDKEIVEVNVLKDFIEFRNYGNHTHILTHGKDKNLKFKGFPLVLDDKTIKWLNEYIDHYEIKNDFIHLEKGDLHQLGYQKTRKFDYRNFMSFAPPSAWIQANFGDSYSGYSIQVIPKFKNEIDHTDYELNYKKIR